MKYNLALFIALFACLLTSINADDFKRFCFAETGAGIRYSQLTTVKTGAGMAISQASGNLLITSGTTANEETIIRSASFMKGAMSLRAQVTLSQRIVNNTFVIELADLIGENLAYVVNSTTAVTVTFPSVNPFTADNIGQSLYLGNTALAGAVPGRFAIAAVSGKDITLTVVGWPATGTGTCMLYGWNYNRLLYDSTTATNVKWDAQRNGWATGDTTATINTTASPGHIFQLQSTKSVLCLSDSLAASTTSFPFTTRGNRLTNIVEDTTPLYLFIRALNGTTSPASTTTFTVGFVSLEDQGTAQKVFLAGAMPSGASLMLPVQVVNTPAISGTVTASNTAGTAAHSAATSGNPVLVGGVVRTAVSTAEAASDAASASMTTGNQLSVKPFGLPETDWQYATPIGTPIVNTTAVAMRAAGAASVRNYVTGVSIVNSSAVASIVTIQDGSTVIWTGYVPATTATPVVVTFLTPLRGTAATAMNFVVNTTATNTFVSAQGYQAP